VKTYALLDDGHSVEDSLIRLEVSGEIYLHLRDYIRLKNELGKAAQTIGDCIRVWTPVGALYAYPDRFGVLNQAQVRGFENS
jgi:hypothetical protein